jgi:RNA polymerase sigma-70 factor (ECF subfamily)
VTAENSISLEEAITRYSHALLKYCYGLLCNYHDAQDAMQETFCKAYARRGGFKGQASIVTWLYKIAYNTCLSMLRKRRFFLAKRTDEAMANMPDPFIGGALAKALAVLSPKERALVYSRAVEDIDYDQLEIIHGVRAATLRKRYERARKKLQKILNAEGYY